MPFGPVEAAGQAASTSQSAVRRNYLADQGLPWYWSLSGNLESLSNRGGGLADGTADSELLTGALAVNSDTLGLAPGGRLKLSLMAVRSDFPSSRFVGDVQGVSNIAAPRALRLYEAWYRQQFQRLPLRLRAGLIDLNQHFALQDSASGLLNSSFGLSPALANDSPISTYPEPGWGAMARWQWRDWQLQGGVFAGQANRRSAPRRRPSMEILELDSRGWDVAGKPTRRWMLGIWHGPGNRTGHRTGAYAGVEQPLTPSLTLFAQYGRTPQHDAAVSSAWILGMDLRGPFAGRPGDRLSIGVTRANLANRPAPEISYELTYIFQIDSAVSLQPDVQYLHRPAGSLPSSWVLGLRLNIGLDRKRFLAPARP